MFEWTFESKVSTAKRPVSDISTQDNEESCESFRRSPELFLCPPANHSVSELFRDNFLSDTLSKAGAVEAHFERSQLLGEHA